MSQMTAKRNNAARWERVTALNQADTQKQVKQIQIMTKVTALLYIGGGALIGEAADSFLCCQYVKTRSAVHGLADYMLIQSQAIDLLNPGNNQIELGTTARSFAASRLQTEHQLTQKIENVRASVAGYTADGLAQVRQILESQLTQTAEQIRSEVSQTYMTESNVMAYVGTQITQTASGLEVQITDMAAFIGALGVNQNTILRYFSFDAAGLTVGKSDSPFKLRLAENRISFLQNDYEVAYITNNKLYIRDAEVTALHISPFVWQTDADNNLELVVTAT